MTPTPEDTAKGICEELARAEAQFDERDWLGMPKHNRDRYIARCMLAAPAISQAIREAEDAAYEMAQANLLQLAIHLEHAMDSLTDAERTPAVIGGYVRDWAATPLKSPKEV